MSLGEIFNRLMVRYLDAEKKRLELLRETQVKELNQFFDHVYDQCAKQLSEADETEKTYSIVNGRFQVQIDYDERYRLYYEDGLFINNPDHSFYQCWRDFESRMANEGLRVQPFFSQQSLQSSYYLSILYLTAIKSNESE